jgi:hypothetical protein
LAQLVIAAVIEVGVDEHGATSLPRQRHGQIRGDGGRAHAALAAADHDQRRAGSGRNAPALPHKLP